MAGITTAYAETQLASYLAAETKVLKGQAYSQGGMSFTRADLGTIREGINYWNDKCLELSAGASRPGIPLKGATPSYGR